MSDPFLIQGPALISFSGGRTSAYMLWRTSLSWTTKTSTTPSAGSGALEMQHDHLKD